MKYLLIIFLVLILLFPHIFMCNAPDDNDTTTGYFDQDDINDPPIVNRYVCENIVLYRGQDRYIYIEVIDVDNASDQLTLKLYISKDQFKTQRTYTFVLDEETHINTTNKYLFVCKVIGDTIGYFEYYVTVFDGDNLIRNPSEPNEFCSIQWFKELEVVKKEEEEQLSMILMFMFSTSLSGTMVVGYVKRDDIKIRLDSVLTARRERISKERERQEIEKATGFKIRPKM